MVLLACVHLGDEAYGVSVADEIERRTGRQAAPAAVYITLRRLEQKGLLSSWKGEPTAERGGKARRHVTVTKVGTAALRESRQAFEEMWRGLDAGARRLR